MIPYTQRVARLSLRLFNIRNALIDESGADHGRNLGGPLTGAAMNPARWFGPAIASGAFDNWYVWWIGPALGAGAAALVYRAVLAEPAEPTDA